MFNLQAFSANAETSGTRGSGEEEAKKGETMNVVKPNKLGIITSLSFGISAGELITGSIDFTSSDYGAIREFMQNIKNDVGIQPSFQKEYMCLYCGSPNKVEHPHCKKCGAPRSFIIG